MEGLFYLGDRICRKSGFAMSMTVFFAGGGKTEDGYWSVRFGYTGNNGQAGFGFESEIRVKTGETISFGEGYKIELADMSGRRQGKKKPVSARDLLVKEIGPDRIVLEATVYH